MSRPIAQYEFPDGRIFLNMYYLSMKINNSIRVECDVQYKHYKIVYDFKYVGLTFDKYYFQDTVIIP